MAQDESIAVHQSFAEIPVYKNGRIHRIATVDIEDFERLSRFKWYFFKNRGCDYASTGIWVQERQKTETIFLHREVMGLSKGDRKQVDHINGDTFDCRRSNLRIVTHAQNAQNWHKRKVGSSTYRGVRHRGNRWYAEARLNGKKHHIGTFITELEAAQAASNWRQEHMPYSNEPPAMASLITSM